MERREAAAAIRVKASMWSISGLSPYHASLLTTTKRSTGPRRSGVVKGSSKALSKHTATPARCTRPSAPGINSTPGSSAATKSGMEFAIRRTASSTKGMPRSGSGDSPPGTRCVLLAIGVSPPSGDQSFTPLTLRRTCSSSRWTETQPSTPDRKEVPGGSSPSPRATRSAHSAAGSRSKSCRQTAGVSSVPGPVPRSAATRSWASSSWATSSLSVRLTRPESSVGRTPARYCLSTSGSWSLPGRKVSPHMTTSGGPAASAGRVWIKASSVRVTWGTNRSRSGSRRAALISCSMPDCTTSTSGPLTVGPPGRLERKTRIASGESPIAKAWTRFERVPGGRVRARATSAASPPRAAIPQVRPQVPNQAADPTSHSVSCIRKPSRNQPKESGTGRVHRTTSASIHAAGASSARGQAGARRRARPPRAG